MRHPWFFPLVDPSTLGRKTLYELASLVHCYKHRPARCNMGAELGEFVNDIHDIHEKICKHEACCMQKKVHFENVDDSGNKGEGVK